jgi:hypothetical protein
MKEVFEVIRETKMARIYDNQDIKVRLVRIIDTPVILSHNRRTRDERDNTCV